jgi:hypothetical protein
MSQNLDGKLEEVFDQLSEEAEQEHAASDPSTTFLATADAEVLREREREYKDPEKHWVRLNPWLKVAKDLAASKGGGLRYLTLPSYYRLDVSLFLQNNLLEVTGEPGGSIQSVYVAAFETDPVKYGRMVGHSPRFKLFGHANIEDALVDSNNEYYKDLISLFPFDIVNLDLTTSLTPRHEGPYSKTMQAVDAVLRRQTDHPSKWGFFLTFRNKPSDWESRALNQLVTNLQSNLDSSPKVRQAFFNLYNEASADELNSKDPKKCISQSVVKWLVDRAHSFNMRLESMNCYEYQRYPPAIEPYLITKHVLIFSRGPVLPLEVPAKTTPRQPWMEDNLVECISRHRPLDVEEKLYWLSHSKPDVFTELESHISSLCSMIR